MRAAKVQASLRIRAVSPEPPLLAHIAVSQEVPSDKKPDPWSLWMSGHAQLKFVMTESSKTQIRLTGLILTKDLRILKLRNKDIEKHILKIWHDTCADRLFLSKMCYPL